MSSVAKVLWYNVKNFLGGEILETFELLSKGGAIMYLLFAISVAVFAIGIERIVFYKFSTQNQEQFLKKLEEVLKTKSAEKVADLCYQEKNIFAKIAFAGVLAATKNENISLALENSYIEIAMNLRAKLNYLSMIVTLAPLLGLLGTIFGMIKSFNIFSLQAGKNLEITGGIGEALIATATGLCVAIFALIIHTYLAQKLDEILSELEKTSNIILAHFGKVI